MDYLEDTQVQSPLYYYVCAHGASNSAPCALCFPGAADQPDNWYETYEPPAPAVGIADEANVGG